MASEDHVWNFLIFSGITLIILGFKDFDPTTNGQGDPWPWPALVFMRRGAHENRSRCKSGRRRLLFDINVCESLRHRLLCWTNVEWGVFFIAQHCPCWQLWSDSFLVTISLSWETKHIRASIFFFIAITHLTSFLLMKLCSLVHRCQCEGLALRLISVLFTNLSRVPGNTIEPV